MHTLTIICFTAIWYFILAVFYGLLEGDKWHFIQQIDKDYIAQFFLLLFAVIMSHLTKVALNGRLKKFYVLPWWDKWFYPLGFIVTYLVINEIAGF